MAQAQEQFEHASGEQKAMYEDRLRSMAERLQEALARKERARSMAEQTKKGHVYIISNIGSFGDDVYKIGLTRRDDPNDRVRELGDSSVPFGFDVHAMILSDDAPALELKLHKHFVFRQLNKVNPRKEFFRQLKGDPRRTGRPRNHKWRQVDYDRGGKGIQRISSDRKNAQRKPCYARGLAQTAVDV